MEYLSFKYQFLIIDTDTNFTDQNIYSWRFVNIGSSSAVINNNYLLQAQQVVNTNNVFDENLPAGQKTAQGYKIKFNTKVGEVNRVQVIMKILVTS